MGKELELTIDFRGENMSLSEARKYINNLSSGNIKPELNDEERRRYNLFKKNTRNSEETEKEYLTGQLEAKIAIKEYIHYRERLKKRN
jgi:hypothetical protein